ncbi:MAG TPA: tetratricopeptide repeat protein [Gemmatimonadales bacterium]|nr:tetratricopeptide repeat protein [Gemmatimonadales bacterium]
MPLPRGAAVMLDSAWAAYRSSRMARADSAFREVLLQCPSDLGALNGLGYVAMRQGSIDAARRLFARSLAVSPDGYDGLTGAGMAAYRQGDTRGARDAFRHAAELFPGDSLIRSYLQRLPASYADVRLPPVQRPAELRVDAKTGTRVFEIPDGKGGWAPLWLKGVNLGAALPGRHPSEFPPDDGTYEKWLALAAEMGSNVIRVYTVHPPHFYRALEQWNRAHPAAPLWLIHGVWTEPPPGPLEERYDDAVWRAEFRTEMKRVVDLLHGHAVIEPRAGHSSGVYTADVSRWTMAYIIGREWEPYSVVAFAGAHPSMTAYRGRFLEIAGGNAAEVWLAEECDFLLRYEVDTYNAIRPVAYTNWPTLDPLSHPTETGLKEEARLRTWIPPEPPHEFDNDAIGLDALKMRPTAANPAGSFASYHAYPYYPDFMVLDPGYARARAPEGPSTYFGYLRELVEHHGDMPVMISEYGVPSSRGKAHVQPQGWNHGGHSEAEQAEIDARLTRDIHASGAAGAVMFEMIDEWFKKNWIVIDFERPPERNRLWLNPLDAEQNYGIVAMRAGPKEAAIAIDGAGEDWGSRGRAWRIEADATTPPLTIRDFRVTSNEAYVYFRLDVGAVDWDNGRYLVGIDTHRPDLGGRTLPYTGTRCAAGMEFVLDLGGPERGYVLVDRPYGLYRTASLKGASPPMSTQIFNRPWRSVAHDDARWDLLTVETNRARVGRDRTVYPPVAYPRNRLRFARESETTLADWFTDPRTGIIEARIPWGMLQVLDPSSRLVLSGTDPGGRNPAGVTTEGFRFVVQSYDPRSPASGGALIGCAAPLRWTWDTWEVPAWHEEIKPVFGAMQATFRAITGPVARPARP